MISTQYLQLINQEIQSKSLTVANTLTDTIISTDLITGILTTTGTAGTTIITGTIDSIDGNGLIMIGILAALFIIAHLLDRKYSYPLYNESKLKEEEDQEVQTEYTKEQ
tara:strand:- start:978 stop:1304 length:327 start_codon:yes stop_codon:yes gene_type:complete